MNAPGLDPWYRSILKDAYAVAVVPLTSYSIRLHVILFYGRQKCGYNKRYKVLNSLQ